jgi:hypothetical protein
VNTPEKKTARQTGRERIVCGANGKCMAKKFPEVGNVYRKIE